MVFIINPTYLNNMNISLEGKSALVCGSSSGIGKATAKLLALRGASVTLLARNKEKLEAVCAELQSKDGQVHTFLTADFDEPEKLKSMIAENKNESFQILVNNSGGPPSGEMIEAEGEEFTKAFQRHIVCNQILVQAVLPGMKATGFGRIINIISTSVRKPIPGLGVSNTIRAAVANWARTLAIEVGPFGITVNNVLPGYTDTGRLLALIRKIAENSGKTEQEVTSEMKSGVPLGRFATALEQAEMIAFLASEVASYITGTSIAVDGGRT